jgi:hypothetical protein
MKDRHDEQLERLRATLENNLLREPPKVGRVARPGLGFRV